MIRKPTTNPSATALRARAFTLIELLVVIAIVALIVGITVPALSSARNLAKESATNSTINSLNMSISQFEAAEQRMPGYFSPEQMGDTQNASRGLSAMQNILLDLVGGPVPDDGSPISSDAIVVGPTTNDQVEVDLNLINLGEGGNNYFVPKESSFGVVQGGVTDADHAKLPDLVDAWGMPILAWAENDLAGPMNDDSDVVEFADLVAGGTNPAHYYWAQNAVYLNSAGLGLRQIAQRKPATDSSEPYSLIGFGGVTVERLAALLGSPSAPLNPQASAASILPRSGRGAIVLQSAGRDLVYLSNKDKGYKEIGGEFFYGRNLTPGSNVNSGQYPRDDGTTGSIDIVDGFDDIVSSSGN